MIFSKGDKLVMIGDSITDCERKRPYGEGLFEGLGKGYVALVDALIHVMQPDLELRIINMGISGNTVKDLKERWQTDVIDLKPDWLSIMIGVNDVWRQFDQPQITESHVYLDEYERTLRELVHQTQPFVKGIVLMTPFYIEPLRMDAMRAMMDRYGSVVKSLAAEKGCLFVDTQSAFDELMKSIYPATLAWDRVHPNTTGHMAIAKAFLNVTGFRWNEDTK
jgi:lysophospholipase L1-like esterase